MRVYYILNPLVYMNMFEKFDKNIDIKETKRYGWKHERTDGRTT